MAERYLLKLVGKRVLVDVPSGGTVGGVMKELRRSGPRVQLDGDPKDRTFAGWRIRGEVPRDRATRRQQHEMGIHSYHGRQLLPRKQDREALEDIADAEMQHWAEWQGKALFIVVRAVVRLCLNLAGAEISRASRRAQEGDPFV